MANGDLNIHVGGKIVASTEPQDMRLQRLLGHMTALLAQEPRSVLVVGFGAGVTAGTFVTHPSIERIVIVEIEPLVTDMASEFFAEFNHDVLKDPRVELIHDDGRHFLLTTDETFDLITADPIHPWMKGAAALYTQEYFELAARHLKPGGVITQWVPLYETTAEVVKSEMATFFRGLPPGGGVGQHQRWSGLRSRPSRDRGNAEDRHRRADGASESGGPCLGAPVPERRRIFLGPGAAVHLCRPGRGPGVLAGGERNQP